MGMEGLFYCSFIECKTFAKFKTHPVTVYQPNEIAHRSVTTPPLLSVITCNEQVKNIRGGGTGEQKVHDDNVGFPFGGLLQPLEDGPVAAEGAGPLQVRGQVPEDGGEARREHSLGPHGADSHS